MKPYSLSAVATTLGGVPVTGYGVDDGVTVTPTGDTFIVEQGADGEVMSSYTGNTLADIKFVLMQGSPSNDFLSTLYVADVEATQLGGGGVGVVPFMLKDLNGTTLVSAPYARICKPPEVKRANKQSNVEWMIKASNVKFYVGGQV